MLDANGNPTGETADWNMIYDQAMYLDLPHRGMEGIANFRYSVDPRVPSDQYDILETGSYEFFISRCSEIMVGVFMH